MQTASKTYLQSIAFSELYSWDVKNYTTTKAIFRKKYSLVLFGEFLSKANINKVLISDTKEYKILGVRSYGKGAYLNRVVKGNTLKMRVYQQAKENHLFWCKVDTKNGAFGIIDSALSDGIASSNMTFAKIDIAKINSDFLQLLFQSSKVSLYLDSFVTGTTNRKYIRPDQLINEIKIPLPSLLEQNELVENYNAKISETEALEKQALIFEEGIEKYLFEKLGIEENRFDADDRFLSFIQFRSIREWGIDKIKNNNRLKSIKYNLLCFEEQDSLYKEMLRGKSPKYINRSDNYILNQKCNRWGSIDIQYAKSVDSQWIDNLNKEQFTKEGDILINSTGEGTIGRSTVITSEYVNLMYDSHILLLRVEERKINPLYFSQLFNSSFGQKQVDSLKSAQSTKQTELGIGNLKKFKFPLPPISIQEEISSHIREIIENIKLLRKKADAMRKDAIIEFEKEIFE